MEELNQKEATELGLFIGELLNLANWLFRMLVVSVLLWLASLIPLLSGPFTSMLLELALWVCIFLGSFILAGNIVAYYYVLGCERNNLDRYIEQNKKKAGK